MNLRTGKSYLRAGYAPTTINHCLTVVSSFYAYHRHYSRGPLVNPVPESRGQRRALANRVPDGEVPQFRRARLRQRVRRTDPRAIPDAMWDEFFEVMTCGRDRAAILLYVSSGSWASELLGVTPGDIDWAKQLIWVVTKGTDEREAVPASPQALTILAAYLDHIGLPTTHRQYERPNGEVIALLVVAPSKSERERVIPMSAELFHAIAQIIRRQTRNGQAIPLVTRYDGHERTWSEPMPFLFQRQMGTIRRVMGPGTVLNMIGRSCEQIAETNVAFSGTKFTPHDFRRLFATEIVNGGLPIHIGAALLGHLNLQTTQGYVAVFAEDIVKHYQQFLNHRRAQRPEGEYGEVTPEEWTEFEEHFDKRKVELGNCARPYGSPCQHEHACIRCPMLQVNPKLLARLDELEKDLMLRHQRAMEEGWLGELEGIEQTLVFLRTKRDEAVRLTQRSPVHLGLPKPRPSEPQ